jgi:acyl carrier protein
MGAQVLAVAADVTDEERMQAVIELAEQTFGQIHGVIHAAGVAGGHLIQTTNRSIAESVLAPKIIGARILSKLFRHCPPDFMLMCSSLQSIMGGPGQSEYAAANAFLDLFAHQLRLNGAQPCLSINWDTWKDVGMAMKAAVPLDLAGLKQNALAGGLDSKIAVPILAQLTTAAFPQVLVCMGDLHARLRDRTENLAALISENALAPGSAVKHPRPDLFTPYVPPSTPTEQAVAEIWQEVLGIDRVGLDDSVFELGGDSVSAVRVSQRLSEKLGVSVSPVRIFSASTVRALAATLTPQQQPVIDFDARQSRGARRRAKRLSA